MPYRYQPAPLVALLIALAVTLVIPVDALSAPSNGDTLCVPQPDGTRVGLRVWGDEFYAVAENL